jgi:hypothetical protein
LFMTVLITTEILFPTEDSTSLTQSTMLKSSSSMPRIRILLI